jgi:L-alanine-DL-glutamate epimerase-like enolase superfamily enzyme
MLKVADVKAIPLSFKPPTVVRLGIGRVVKRDAVVVKVVTDDGIVGWGEAHHGRAPSTIANLINHTLRDMVVGESVHDVVGIWSKIYRMQLKSHGLGAATSMAMSGIDMALWDIRGKDVGRPLYQLLGGAVRPVKAYAGGVSLGWQEPSTLAEEASRLVGEGYRALKLRIGRSPKEDIASVKAVREAVGADVAILVDANTEYSLDDVRAVVDAFEELGVGWLEEPFPPHDHRSYAMAKEMTGIPLAAGENHYTRVEFSRVVEDGVISILQPDVSKVGGITEGLRVAALGSTWKLPICPHTSMTGLNMAATIHFLSAIENGGYFESDVSVGNLFREELTTRPFQLAGDGTVKALEGPGIGVEVDEKFIAAHPFVEGASFTDIIR